MQLRNYYFYYRQKSEKNVFQISKKLSKKQYYETGDPSPLQIGEMWSGNKEGGTEHMKDSEKVKS
jgi:hypothetical protein